MSSKSESKTVASSALLEMRLHFDWLSSTATTWSSFFVNNEVNMGTATVAVYADINNEKKLLKPGSYVNVSIASSKPKKGMVIPESAVVQSEGNSLVFVVNEENIAKIRPIKLGEAFDGKQVVEFGLRIGEKVLTSGLSNRMLRDGAQINVMNAQK
jgi:RND family efflux transporter MFP subunit